MKETIKLLKPLLGKKPGQTLSVTPAEARVLIAIGHAEAPKARRTSAKEK